MTTEQIKDLIASAIAGQGNQVDLAGALPTILDAIADAVGKATPLRITVNSEGGIPAPTASQKAQIKAALDSGQNVELLYEDEFVSPIVMYDISPEQGVIYVSVVNASGVKQITLV